MKLCMAEIAMFLTFLDRDSMENKQDICVWCDVNRIILKRRGDAIKCSFCHDSEDLEKKTNDNLRKWLGDLSKVIEENK